jgi:hypothetical protein
MVGVGIEKIFHGTRDRKKFFFGVHSDSKYFLKLKNPMNHLGLRVKREFPPKTPQNEEPSTSEYDRNI